MGPQRKFALALGAALAYYNLRVQEEYPIGKYFADVHVHPNWVFEIDGREHYFPARKDRDSERTRFMESMGKKVMRFTNRQVEEHLEKIVYEAIRAIIHTDKRSEYVPVMRAHSVVISDGRFV